MFIMVNGPVRQNAKYKIQNYSSMEAIFFSKTKNKAIKVNFALGSEVPWESLFLGWFPGLKENNERKLRATHSFSRYSPLC